MTGLRKEYGDTVAVDRLDLIVPRGATCALLGPNGSGKTTTIRAILRITAADAGRGPDPRRDPDPRPARPGRVSRRQARVPRHGTLADVPVRDALRAACLATPWVGGIVYRVAILATGQRPSAATLRRWIRSG